MFGSTGNGSGAAIDILIARDIGQLRAEDIINIFPAIGSKKDKVGIGYRVIGINWYFSTALLMYQAAIATGKAFYDRGNIILL